LPLYQKLLLVDIAAWATATPIPNNINGRVTGGGSLISGVYNWTFLNRDSFIIIIIIY